MGGQIDKENLISAVNALSKSKDIMIMELRLKGEDHCDSSYVEVLFPYYSGNRDAICVDFEGETYQEMLFSIVQGINDALADAENRIKENRLELKNAPTYRVCNRCGSSRLYELEFRTDYALPRLDHPVNAGTPELSQDALPYRISGTFCMGCREFCDPVIHIGSLPKAKNENGSDEDGE